MVKTSLIFSANGHTFMLLYPKGDPTGANEALESWRDNPDVPLSVEDHDRLIDRLNWMVTIKGLFSKGAGMF